MLFNSYTFLFAFLPLALVAFHGLRALGYLEASIAALTLASVAFYAYWRPADTPILLVSIAFNFAVAQGLARSGPGLARLLLTGGVAGDLALLGYFKYFNFLAANLAAAVGSSASIKPIVMPIGISFFTFTQIAYLVDCMRSRNCERNVSHYSLFVTLFPHLIAGPIIHHAEMRPQFDHLARIRVDREMILQGVLMFVLGLAKKVLLADNLATGADTVFDAADKGMALDAAAAWSGVAAYTLQIYFDFSGYSDMAIGLALMFGLRLPLNFDSPYKSRSIIEFWRRWHITLSTWLRDYLYIPLGGNRGGEWSRLRNIFITMLLGGIWHGAGWTFVIWGALHGGYIVGNHLLRGARPGQGRRKDPAPEPSYAGLLKQASTLLLVMLAWVFFRAKTVAGALLVLGGMAGGGAAASAAAAPQAVLYGLIALGAALALFAPNSQQLLGYQARIDPPLAGGSAATPAAPAPAARWGLGANPMTAVTCGVLFAVASAQLWRPAVFIYFNF